MRPLGPSFGREQREGSNGLVTAIVVAKVSLGWVGFRRYDDEGPLRNWLGV